MDSMSDKNYEKIMDTEEGRKAFSEILDIFTGVEDKEDMLSLFDDLFTDSEINDIVLRFLLMDDLYRGKSQRDIASARHISLCKITRGSRMLKKKNGFMKALLSAKYDDHLHL